MKITTLSFIAIILLAGFLRFNQLNTLPALNADEAAIGYNAYSLLMTGKDEHGNPWPLHFQSFNDYKPGLYFYIVLPFVQFLGLNEWAVRLPGATLGVLTVIFVWLLVKGLFPNKKWLPELSALFLAISPWHIHFSRGGWEVNAATFFITLGVWGFVKGVKHNKWFLLSYFSFAASLYTYHAARLIVPLLILGLLLIYRKSIFRRTNTLIRISVSKTIILAGLLGIILLLPLLRDLTGPAGASRAAGVGIFADAGPFWRINEQRGEHQNFSSPPTIAFHNKLVNYGLTMAENYTEHFWGEFLFLSGDDIERNKVPEFGQMYLFDTLFVLAGLFAVAKSGAGFGPILIWLVLAPIAAAFTFQSPHALRAQNMVVPLSAISAFGAYNLVLWTKEGVKFSIPAGTIIRNSLFVILATFVTWDFSRYIHQYYYHLSKTYNFATQNGFGQLVGYLSENQDKYQNVVITDRYDQPYILTLFYLKYPPDKFQNDHELTPRDRFGFSTVRSFDKYRFVEIMPWDKIREEYPNSLIIGTAEEIPDGTNVIYEIKFPSGDTAFKVVAN